MEQFYQLLKNYNKRFAQANDDLPEWFYQYTADIPPLYWKTVFDILKNVDKTYTIVEIGAGYGDVTALLYFMGFRNIVSFEREITLKSIIENKSQSLLGITPKIRNEEYPARTEFTPDILILVNCVYADNLKSKEEYINQIRQNYQINGNPQIFILEVIDSSYREKNETFPYSVRLSETDIKTLFPNCTIDSFETYQYPQNKTTKKLYKICR